MARRATRRTTRSAASLISPPPSRPAKHTFPLIPLEPPLPFSLWGSSGIAAFRRCVASAGGSDLAWHFSHRFRHTGSEGKPNLEIT